jgi:hypothetical protein
MRRGRQADDIRTPATEFLAARELPEVDICIIVEGCYPYRRGGVSNWVDALLRDQSDFTFAVVAIQPAGTEAAPLLYAAPPNLRALERLELGRRRPVPLRGGPRADLSGDALAAALIELWRGGGLDALRRVRAQAHAAARGCKGGIAALADTRLGWDIACRMYREMAPSCSFLGFYWTWRA